MNGTCHSLPPVPRLAVGDFIPRSCHLNCLKTLLFWFQSKHVPWSKSSQTLLLQGPEVEFSWLKSLDCRLESGTPIPAEKPANA
jgi:hypothetical protein